MSTNIIVTGSFSKDLQPLVTKWSGLEYSGWDTKYTQYTSTISTKEKYTEHMINTHGLGLMRRKDEAGNYSYDGGGQGVLKRYTQTVFGSGFKITREAKDDGHALDLAKMFSKEARRSALQTVEFLCANIVNNAFTYTAGTAYAGADGKALLATDHPTFSGSTNSNTQTNDFSEAAYEQMTTDLATWVNQRGFPIAAKAQKILINPAGMHDVNRVVSNPDRPATSDRDINSTYQMGTCPGGVVLVPYFTDTDAWFVTTDATDNCICYVERDGFEISQDGEFDTDVAKFKFRIRCDVGFSDPLGMYGSPGA